jgi:hypothetical protein
MSVSSEEFLQSILERTNRVIPFDDLPQERVDPIWDDLKTACGLTIRELSVLKNRRCTPAATTAALGKYIYIILIISYSKLTWILLI